MLHACAIISDNIGTGAGKIETLKSVAINIAEIAWDIPFIVEDYL
jgi:succinyl-CoA synthetase alpha subunit